jgi:hypothetical protein
MLVLDFVSGTGIFIKNPKLLSEFGSDLKESAQGGLF